MKNILQYEECVAVHASLRGKAAGSKASVCTYNSQVPRSFYSQSLVAHSTERNALLRMFWIMKTNVSDSLDCMRHG